MFRFPEAKLIEGICGGTDIRKLFKDAVFEKVMLTLEENDLHDFIIVVSKFLETKKILIIKMLLKTLIYKV